MREYSQVEIAEKTTAAEFFDQAPEKQAQLVDGVMLMPTPATIPHERLQSFLVRLVGDYVEEHGLGEALGGNAPVQLSETQVFVPDVLFVSRARQHIIQTKAIAGAPDFVVEILSASTSSFDRGAKRRHYAEYGVAELWLIDPYGPQGTTFYQRTGSRLEDVKPQAGVLHSTAIPGFAVRVQWLWPDGDFITVRQALKEMETL